MPVPLLIKQDQALAIIGEEGLKGPALWKARYRLRKEVLSIGGKVIHLLGPNDIRYRKTDIDKLIEQKSAA